MRKRDSRREETDMGTGDPGEGGWRRGGRVVGGGDAVGGRREPKGPEPREGECILKGGGAKRG